MHCVGCYTQTYTTFVVTQIADQWLDHGRQDDLIHGVCVPIHYRAHDIVHDDRVYARVSAAPGAPVVRCDTNERLNLNVA